ncbi:rCG35117 [Rattus norvegicus]|uniref:RCG35117 n=1 Tax=Rattus norvegicus TaxID=10116 RepID=A6HF78_RAT|nr:rCG35117 [Rattus norvegicus]
MLGTLHQHRANSAALQTGPRCIQAHPDLRHGLHSSTPCSLSLYVTS